MRGQRSPSCHRDRRALPAAARARDYRRHGFAHCTRGFQFTQPDRHRARASVRADRRHRDRSYAPCVSPVRTDGRCHVERTVQRPRQRVARGLGTNRTLVLLDGRRPMPADGNGSVDLNILPPSLIRSVQVLTGGASAVYGSDALAGWSISSSSIPTTAWSSRQRFATEQATARNILPVSPQARRLQRIAAPSSATWYASRTAIDNRPEVLAHPLEYVPGMTAASARLRIPRSGSASRKTDSTSCSPAGRYSTAVCTHGYSPGSHRTRPDSGQRRCTLFTIATRRRQRRKLPRERDPSCSTTGTTTSTIRSGHRTAMPLERSSAFLRARLR